MRVLVVGAGFYGATCARELAVKGHSVLVVEKRDHVAGNCHTPLVPEVGCRKHAYGAHIFHTGSKRVWDYACRFADFNRYRHQVRARSGKRVFSFPINLMTLQQVFGRSFTPEQARAKLERERCHIPVPANMEQWCLRTIGRRLYELFVEGYSEKQWGRHPKLLPAGIIKRIPVRLDYDESYFGSQLQGIPAGGYTEMVEEMLRGVSVELGVDYEKSKLTGATSLLWNNPDLVIYTGPVDAYYGYRLGHLEYRSLRFEDELLDVSDFQGNSVVNYLDRDVPFTRIIEHRHFDLLKGGSKTLITREFPDEWSPGKVEFYPVNDEKNQALLRRYQELAVKETSVHFGGRLGSYLYYDMDMAMASALKFCDGIG